jgi:hypothetical protein
VSVSVWRSVDVVGRALYRWATGTRDANVASPDPGGGTVEVSDSIDYAMWGVDIGVRWNATPMFRLEGGWRYRDQTLKDGPATFGGPQIKAVLEF